MPRKMGIVNENIDDEDEDDADNYYDDGEEGDNSDDVVNDEYNIRDGNN